MLGDLLYFVNSNLNDGLLSYVLIVLGFDVRDRGWMIDRDFRLYVVSFTYRQTIGETRVSTRV